MSLVLCDVWIIHICMNCDLWTMDMFLCDVWIIHICVNCDLWTMDMWYCINVVTSHWLCIFDIKYCILVSVFALLYAALHVPVQFFAYRSFPSIVLYVPVVRLPLPFSSKNMKMKMIERFSVRFRPFSTLAIRNTSHEGRIPSTSRDFVFSRISRNSKIKVDHFSPYKDVNNGQNTSNLQPVLSSRPMTFSFLVGSNKTSTKACRTIESKHRTAATTT